MDMEEVVGLVSRKLDVPSEDAEKIIEKAVIGGEVLEGGEFSQWYNERFLPNCMFIDETGYSKMCVDALKILSRTAATDYGSSRQRDLGQLWADMTRGYLGEYAFLLFLKERWGITAKLGHEIGQLQDYLPMDIHKIKGPDADYRAPSIKISVKTTKWNGIWLDIPGDQFNHSDVHVLVKVGAGRDHLFAFFKKISVFKDKVLKRGEDIGSLSAEESSTLYDSLPSFKPIPAYICGFVLKNAAYENLAYEGKKGRLNYKITAWNGPILPGDLDAIKRKESVSGRISFEGIGDFAHDKGYLFNTGNLLWAESDWKKVCASL